MATVGKFWAGPDGKGIDALIRAANTTQFTSSGGAASENLLNSTVGLQITGVTDTTTIGGFYNSFKDGNAVTQALTIFSVQHPLISIDVELDNHAWGTALLHELLHVVYSKTGDGHAEIWKGLGIATSANGNSFDWIKGGCK